VACPHGHEPADDVLDRAWRLQADHGGFLEVTYDPARAVSGAHVVYTDVWAAPDGDPEWRAALGGYRVTAALMATADARAIFLHPRPAHRGEEVDAAVIDGLRSAVGRQAANRLPGEQALMYALITGDWEGAR
jgi:ornithine carbamoyltransferase